MFSTLLKKITLICLKIKTILFLIQRMFRQGVLGQKLAFVPTQSVRFSL